jgi:enterochelin esterase-like enzyme
MQGVSFRVLRALRQIMKLKASVAKFFSLVFALMPAVLSSCHAHKKEAWETVPLQNGEVEVAALAESSGLKVDRVRFFSHEMKEPRFFLALIPKTSEPVQRVLIVNHGWADRPEYLLTNLRLDEAYAKLLNENVLKPAILVLPDIRFDNSYRSRSESNPFPEYLTLVAEEVSNTVSEHYAIPFVRENWSMAGFSFGGYVSLDVGRRYCGRFESIGVVSAFFDKDWLFWPDAVGENLSADSKGRSKQTVVVPGPIPRIFLACGSGDRFFNAMETLHQSFEELGIPHEWSTAPGGHTWEYWSSVLDELLRFSLGN